MLYRLALQQSILCHGNLALLPKTNHFCFLSQMTWFRLDTEDERRKSASFRSALERCKHHASLTILRATSGVIRLNILFGWLKSPTGIPSFLRGKPCMLLTNLLAQCQVSLVLPLVVVQLASKDHQTCGASLRHQLFFQMEHADILPQFHHLQPSTSQASRIPDTCSLCSLSPNPYFASNFPISIPALCIHSLTAVTLARRWLLPGILNPRKKPLSI
jgi:hypothetical protein